MANPVRAKTLKLYAREGMTVKFQPMVGAPFAWTLLPMAEKNGRYCVVLGGLTNCAPKSGDFKLAEIIDPLPQPGKTFSINLKWPQAANYALLLLFYTYDPTQSLGLNVETIDKHEAEAVVEYTADAIVDYFAELGGTGVRPGDAGLLQL